jgi:hypothetical protein
MYVCMCLSVCLSIIYVSVVYYLLSFYVCMHVSIYLSSIFLSTYLPLYPPTYCISLYEEPWWIQLVRVERKDQKWPKLDHGTQSGKMSTKPIPFPVIANKLHFVKPCLSETPCEHFLTMESECKWFVICSYVTNSTKICRACIGRNSSWDRNLSPWMAVWSRYPTPYYIYWTREWMKKNMGYVNPLRIWNCNSIIYK